MRVKSCLACLLAMLLLFSLVPAGQARAELNWSSSYEVFVLDEGFLYSGQSFFSDAIVQPRFCLYDFDGDGIPELLAFNGSPALAMATVHVYQAAPMSVNYVDSIGFRGCRLYSYADAPGALYCTDGNNGVVRTVRYTMQGGGVAAEELGEIGADAGGTPNYLTFYTAAEIRGIGWEAYIRSMLGAPDTPAVGTVLAAPVEQQYAANIFLSNFSEQRAFEKRGFDANNWNIDDIVTFAYLYCKINRRAALNVAQNDGKSYYTLSLDDANAVWNRHFGFTLSEAEAETFPTKRPNSSYYDLGLFYFPAADGESYNRLTVVRQMEDLGDGTYRMVFDIYTLDIMVYFADNGVDSGFYGLTSDEADRDSRLTWDSSGVALVRPYVNNGNATFQLFFYAVGDEEALPEPTEEPVIAPQRIYTKADAYSADDPSDRSGGIEKLGGNYEEFQWGSLLFETPSRQLKGQDMSDQDSALYNLAMLCGSLCIDSYDADYLVQAYRDLGMISSDISLYSYPKKTQYNRRYAERDGRRFADDEDLAFSLATMPMTVDGVETDIVFITARGTLKTYEGIKDGTARGDKDFYGYLSWDWVWEFEEDIFAGLDDFHVQHPALGQRPMKFVVSGHSLGGAAANLVAARLNLEAPHHDAWYADAITADDVYCFTFGAIDSLVNLEAYKNRFENSGSAVVREAFHKLYNRQMDFPITEGFENIIDIYNCLDTFGPITRGYTENIMGLNVPLEAAGATGYGRFGSMLTFRDAMIGRFPDSKWPTHEIVGYVRAVKQGKPKTDAGTGIRYVARCPVDVELFEGDRSVLRIENDTLLYAEEGLAACVEDGAKVILAPDGRDFRLCVTATDSGTMDFTAADLTNNRELAYFEGVELSAGKRFVSRIGGEAQSSQIALQVLDSEGAAIRDVQADGTETEIGQSADAPRQERSAPRSTVVIVALAAAALVCLGVLLAAAGKRSAKKREKAAPARPAERAADAPPAFSGTRCCVCGRALGDGYKLFFRTEEGEEARLDLPCYRQLNTLMKGTDLEQLRSARQFVRSRCGAVDPRIARQLQKCLEISDERLREI